MNASATCSGCKFFADLKNGQGECRHRSPQMHFVPTVSRVTGRPVMEVMSGWPRVLASHWCGEFEFDLGADG